LAAWPYGNARRTEWMRPNDAFRRRLLDQLRAEGSLPSRAKPAAQRRWGFFALPVLHDDRVVGKVDATADRKASRLRASRLEVHAVHGDVPLRRVDSAPVMAARRLVARPPND
jgi:uncharacterized protein YcaQ